MIRLCRAGVLLALLVSIAHASPPAPTGLQVVETGDGWARLRWDASPDSSVVGYRIKYSLVPGEHTDMTDWNGRSAAFTFTTDDGWEENRTYAEIFERYGVRYTLFVIPHRIGWSGYLTEADLVDLHQRGHEIASHTYSHPVLLRDTAFTLSYVGPGTQCLATIANGRLTTNVDHASDLDIDLADSAVACFASLVDTLDAHQDYECILDYYDCTLEYCKSIDVDPAGPWDIAAQPLLATNSWGCDSTELQDEMVSSKQYFEALLDDSAYSCVSIAYPRHAHDQREMNAVLDAGYLGARNGPRGYDHPGQAPVSYNYLDRVNLYQAPLTWGRPPNDSTEAWSRAWMQTRIAAWKAANEWTIFLSHDFDGLDSAHTDWVIDEITADGDVWVATFGDVSEYIRPFHVTVENPIEPGSDSLAVSAPLYGLAAGPWIYAVVTAFDASEDESEWSNEVAFQAVDTQTDIAGPPVPSDVGFRLGLPRPSPMNPEVRIPFDLSVAGPVRLRVLDARGREIRSLVDGPCSAGRHEITWRGRDGNGREVPSGPYFFRLETVTGRKTRKVVLIR